MAGARALAARDDEELTMAAPTPTIDMRSDLLSRPSPEIIEAICTALSAAPAFELREDAAQRKLEARMAELLGHEDALLFPTCTMANQAALLLQARPGETVLAPADAHITTSEAGAPEALAGVRMIGLPGVMPDPAAWWDMSGTPADAQRSRVAMFLIENTHNRAGGQPLPPEYVDAVLHIAAERGIRSHLDGARLLNAAIALDVPLRALASGFDTVAISLNKGLGAPFGGILTGARKLIGDAVVVRQRLGGGIRPTGFLAAGALAALDDLSHVAEDHRRARRLAAGLAAHATVDPPATNIVLLHLHDVQASSQDLCAALADDGVVALPFGAHTVRFVTYRGITDSDIERVIAAVAGALRRSSGAAGEPPQKDRP